MPDTCHRRRWLLLAPVVFLLHVAEEAPGLVDWFNRHVQPPMTQPIFIVLNAGSFIITALLVLLAVTRGVVGRSLALALVGWLSFLMLANGTLHVLASLWFREYVPGVVTAIVCYFPYFAVAFGILRDAAALSTRAAVTAALIGAAPMLIQGGGVLLIGRRFFW